MLLHMLQCGLVGMKERMFAMVERLLRFMIGADIVFGAAMRSRLGVVLGGRVVMLGGSGMMRRATEVKGCRHGGRGRLVWRAREITGQGTALVLGIKCAGGVPVLHRAQLMATRDQRLMRRMGVVLANLVVARGLAMEMCGLIVMARGG